MQAHMARKSPTSWMMGDVSADSSASVDRIWHSGSCNGFPLPLLKTAEGGNCCQETCPGIPF
jgi:hypothetical protein